MRAKKILRVALTGAVCLFWPGHGLRAETGPDPICEKPRLITMAELEALPVHGVKVVEVSDYAPGKYRGELKPCPPHADHNPKKAIIVRWENSEQRFVFSHEASYCPWLEFSNGVGLCNQFFEGNLGWAELFNENGRKERNSFVDIVQSGPDRAWVRWNYFCVQASGDSQPALRGTEDYVVYPNGLIWRRLTYETLIPDKPEGYSWQPIDFFALAPTGTGWQDLFEKTQQGDYRVAVALDLYSNRQYEVFWSDDGALRRTGDAELLWSISKSKGFALVMPFRAGCGFVVMGESSGFPAYKNQILDNSFRDTGGWGWGARRWDHWPVGWVNAQEHRYLPGSELPYHFGPLSHFLVPFRLNDCEQYQGACADMEHNRWSERHVFYTLAGITKDLGTVRRIGKKWLDQGPVCARPESAAKLR